MNKYLLQFSLCLFIISAGMFPYESYAQNYDENLYEALEYRLIGPFLGGRSAAVTGVPGKPNLFYLVAGGGISFHQLELNYLFVEAEEE